MPPFELIMELYIFENYKTHFPDLTGQQLTDHLIMKALAEYGTPADTICRTEKGKPYVNEDIFFSVSHSGGYFVCLVSDRPVGVDIQKERYADMKKISRRYFTHEECTYADEAGRDGFFLLWTRKEAYCKYTGRGLEEILKGTPVINREDVEFFDFQLEKGLYCSCCREK